MLRRLALAIIILVLVLLGAVAGLVFWALRGDAGRQALERQASAWMHVPVSIGKVSVVLFPQIGVRLDAVRVGAPALLSVGQIDVAADVWPLLQQRIEHATLIVANSRLQLPLPYPVPFGSDEAESGQAGASKGLRIVSIRSIGLRDVVVSSRGREVTLSAESSLDANVLDIRRFSARAGKTTLEATGKVELEPRVVARLDVKADRLDLDDLLALVNAFGSGPRAPSTKGRAGSTTRMELRLASPEVSVAGVRGTGLTATVASDDGGMSIDPLVVTLFGGSLKGSMALDVRDTLAGTVRVTTTGLEVAQLAAFGGISHGVTGRLNASGQFTGRGRDLGDVLSTARGKGEAVISHGEIQGLELVRAVVLFFGRTATDASTSNGGRFDRISASFILGDGVLRSDDLTLRSPDVDVAAAGTLGLKTTALDVRGNLLLSEGLSAQAGSDLLRYTREGNRVVLPATISGTLTAPRVGIDAAAALKRGLRNELQERMRGLLDRLTPPA